MKIQHSTTITVVVPDEIKVQFYGRFEGSRASLSFEANNLDKIKDFLQNLLSEMP